MGSRDGILALGHEKKCLHQSHSSQQCQACPFQGSEKLDTNASALKFHGLPEDTKSTNQLQCFLQNNQKKCNQIQPTSDLKVETDSTPSLKFLAG